MPRNVNANKQKEVEERIKGLNNRKNEEDEGETKLMKNLSKSKPYRPQMNPKQKEEPVIIIDKELLEYSDEDEYSYEEDEGGDEEVESSSARSSPARPSKNKKKPEKQKKKESDLPHSGSLDVNEIIRQLALEQEQLKAELEAERKRKEEKAKKKPEKQKKKEYVHNVIQLLAEDYNIRKSKKETYDKMIGNTRGQLMSAVKF